MTDVLAIADDRTGAMDTAAPFAARGARVVVCEPGATYPPAEVLVVDTGTRHASPHDAAAAVGRAIAGAPAAVVRFKKIDSTLRGNVVAELRAAAAGMHGVIVAPAVPWQGRVVRGGRVIVHGVPLAVTEAASDARSPAFGGDLAAALGGGAEMPDAATVDDLVRIVRSASPQVLLAGAAGLAEALAQVRYGAPVEVDPPVAAHMLFVVGSRTALARRQVAALGPLTDDVLVAPTGDDDPEAVASELAAEAAHRHADALVLVGGDTATAVLRAIGCTHVEVHGMVAGLPWGTAHTPSGPRTVLTKAGGFGTDTTLAEVWNTVRSA